MDYHIRHLPARDWDIAMQLAWDTFLMYEAPDYEPEGSRHFYEFVKGSELKNMFRLGEYYAWGAYDDRDILVGILGIRKHWHISLLFVESRLHHQGIATRLLKQAFREAREEGVDTLTVFSSPYAVPFYHRIGFTDTDREHTTDGIRYTPMSIELF